MPLVPELTITTGPFRGTVVRLERDQDITLGRSDAANVMLPDRTVSRLHCKISFDGESCRIQDANSRGGTYVNGERITAPHQLKTGDEVRIGETCVSVELVDAMAESKAWQGSSPRMTSVPAVPAGNPGAGTSEGQPSPPPDAEPRTPVSPATIGTLPAAPGRSGWVEPGLGRFLAEDMLLANRFCETCGKLVIKRELAEGKARLVDGKLLCAQCDALSPGKTLGQYRILEPLGQVAIGMVFKAEHVTLKRVVALKVLLEHLAENQEEVSRFLRHATAEASLSHANVVQTFDAGEDKGLYYLVQEHVPGRTLRELIQQDGPLPLAQALDVGLQVARALQYAYERKIVHRELRPANILFTPEGVVKVVDMGTRMNLEDSGLSPPGRTNLTGDIINFVSPEQIDDRKLDHRCDAYALGGILYYLLAGSSPYQAESLEEFFKRFRAEDLRPLRELRRDVPEPVEAFVRRLMARDPDARPRNPNEIVARLTELLERCSAPVAQRVPPVAPAPGPAVAGPTPVQGAARRPASTVVFGEDEPPQLETPLPAVAPAPGDGDVEDLSLDDRERALHVIRKMIPAELPQVPGYEIAHAYRPAKAVGGDYVDMFEIAYRRHVVIIADVAGKGYAGALFMINVRSAMREVGLRGLSPRETLVAVNRRICQEIPQGMFVSAIYGILDSAQHTFSMASAGHNPPVIWKAATRRTALVRVRGRVLGVRAEQEYALCLEECVFNLFPLDRILLYTDGVTEAKDAEGRDWSEEQLCEVVGKSASTGSHAMLGEVLRGIDRHRGDTRRSDDVTMLAIRRLEP
ncbi:MAG: SpoIIE family protein phosphatase [Planctomycetes bacterium]|nr:SpoIIE family protein phosphatase [Planctomycetota bacterium]